MTLGDALEAVVGGGTPAREVPDYWGGAIPWAGVKDLRSSRLLTTMERITQAGLDSGSTRLISRGTVVVATRMAVGRVVWTEINTAINQDLKALVAGPALHPRFLFHFMKANEAWLESKGSGTTVNGIRLETLLRLPLYLPPLAEQRAIATTLDQIDEAIAEAEGVIAAAAVLNQSLLRDLLTHGVPGRHVSWQHRPGLGTVPACWGATKVGDVSSHVTKGATPTTFGHRWVESGHVFLRSECVGEGVLLPAGAMRITKLAHEELRRSQIQDGDILMTITGYIGRVCRVPPGFGEASINQHIARIRVLPNRATAPSFTYWALRSPRTRAALRDQVTGLAYPQIGLAEVRSIVLPVPPADEQDAIVSALESAAMRLDADNAALASLRRLKTSAADALLRGLVRVPNDSRSESRSA